MQNWDALLNDFFITYPEFKPLEEAQSQNLKNLMQKIACLYPQYSDIGTQCNKKYPFFMLVAHYFVLSGFASSIGISASNGIVIGSSIDSVSVSLQAPPYNNNFTYWLGQTKYGQEYASYLATIRGIRYVN